MPPPAATPALQLPPPPRLPWRPLAQLLLLWLLFAAFGLGKEAVPRCSWRFALLLGCSAALGLGLAAAFARLATRQQRRPEEQGGGAGADPASQPILPSGERNSAGHAERANGSARSMACTAADASGEGWTARQLAGAMAVALLGGGLGGMVGLGGGMLLSPLFLGGCRVEWPW